MCCLDCITGRLWRISLTEGLSDLHLIIVNALDLADHPWPSLAQPGIDVMPTVGLIFSKPSLSSKIPGMTRAGRQARLPRIHPPVVIEEML